MPAYRHVFPFDADQMNDAAYYFQYDHPQFDDARRAGAAIEQFVWEWQGKRQAGTAGTLTVSRSGDQLVLKDSRYTRERSAWALDPFEMAMLMACDRPVSRSTAVSRAAAAGDESLDPLELSSALRRLEEKRAVLQIGNLLITLACVPSEVRDIARGDPGASASTPRRSALSV
jgi:hypothetical protein